MGFIAHTLTLSKTCLNQINPEQFKGDRLSETVVMQFKI